MGTKKKKKHAKQNLLRNRYFDLSFFTITEEQKEILFEKKKKIFKRLIICLKKK